MSEATSRNDIGGSNDWIIDCDAQGQVYPLLNDAIVLLMNLIS